jgi:membrane fusion protein (multidrug efflux system)
MSRIERHRMRWGIPGGAALMIWTSLTWAAIAQGPPAAKVVVSPAVSGKVQDRTELIGVAEPWRESTVAAEVAGRVESLDVRRGDRVKRGRVLAQLGKSELAFRLKEAQAQRNATRVRLEKAKDLLERSEKLIEGRAIAEREHRQIDLNVQETEQDLAASEAEISRLQDELDKKTVRAPFDGVVTQELTQVGEWVEQGGAIVHLVDLSRVRVVADTPEKYVSGVKEDEEVSVRFDALGDRPFKGKIHALIPFGNRDAHIFPLEIYIGNPDLAVKPGMLARVGFDLGLNRKAVMVHKDAVITRGEKTFLFTVTDGKARQVFVTTGRSEGERIEVSGSVKEGEAVIIRGNERVRDGQAVQIVPLSGKAPS